MPDPGNVQAYNRYLYALGNPIKYNDPSGHCVDGISTVACVAVTLGLVGGTANAVGNIGGQFVDNYYNNEQTFTESVTNISLKEAGVAFGAGFVSGASAPFVGPIGAVIVGGGASYAQSVVTQKYVDGVETIDQDAAITSAILGGIGGGVQGALLKDIPATFAKEGALYGGEEYLTRLGSSTDAYAWAVAPQTAKMAEGVIAGEQVVSTIAKPVGFTKLGTGVAIANVPVSSPTCSGFWSCLGEKLWGSSEQSSGSEPQ